VCSEFISDIFRRHDEDELPLVAYQKTVFLILYVKQVEPVGFVEMISD